MNDIDLKMMIIRTHDEIIRLRRRLEEAEPKARSYDALLQVLDMMPKSSQGFGEDVAWLLKQELDRVNARISETNGANAQT